MDQLCEDTLTTIPGVWEKANSAFSPFARPFYKLKKVRLTEPRLSVTPLVVSVRTMFE